MVNKPHGHVLIKRFPRWLVLPRQIFIAKSLKRSLRFLNVLNVLVVVVHAVSDAGEDDALIVLRINL